MYVVLVIAIAYCVLLAPVDCADLESPCPHILKYEEQKANDRWQGVLELRDREGLEGIWLNIVLDSKADVLINTFGQTTTLNNQNFAIHNPDFKLQPNGVLKIKFTVKYNPERPIPNVASIRLNGVEICANGIASGGNSVIGIPGGSGITASPSPETPNSSTKTLITSVDGEMCGIKPQVRPLVYHGRNVERHWPWHTAIMLLRNTKLDYHCGGSLITETSILTAAHCVTMLSTKKIIDKDMFVIYLGMIHLSDPGPSFKLRLVADIKVHDEYNPTRYHNDLAIMVLNNPMEFNDFIRPVCLWDGDLNIQNLIGKYGTVVGWGIDNTNQTSPDLMEAEMPVVGLDVCLYQDRNFFSQYTSPKTYCAGGGKNGTAVCSGDSGGGMVFPKPGTTGKEVVWYIRGLVSISPRDTNSVCNTKSYAVFTDVAQHLPWIKETANLK